MRELGINVFGGANWDSHIDDVCDNMSEFWCKYARKTKSKQP